MTITPTPTETRTVWAWLPGRHRLASPCLQTTWSGGPCAPRNGLRCAGLLPPAPGAPRRTVFHGTPRSRRRSRTLAFSHRKVLSLAMEFRDRQQLDRVAELGRVGNVHRRDAGDAFDVHVLEVHRRPEGEVHQDRQLVGGVDALYIERRIGFRVARLLRFLQDFVERATGF